MKVFHQPEACIKLGKNSISTRTDEYIIILTLNAAGIGCGGSAAPVMPQHQIQRCQSVWTLESGVWTFKLPNNAYYIIWQPSHKIELVRPSRL
jgi:hypothetical protein